MINFGAHTLYGGPLRGDTPLRYVYVDEAGTSAKEPVSVVVGIVVNADHHWRRAQSGVDKLLDDFVPSDRRKGFIFHAKQIWGDEKIRAGWPDEDRFSLLHGMMHLPRRLGLAIALGVVRRDPNCFEILPDKGASFAGKISPAQWEHYRALSFCLNEADRYIRSYGAANEVGTVVAESLPDLMKFMSSALPVGRTTNREIPIDHIRPTAEELHTGLIKQNRDFRIERLVDTIHFVDKKNAPLLQIADACAFGMRRWLSGQSSGLEFARSIVDDYRLVPGDWAGPASCGLFYWHLQKATGRKQEYWSRMSNFLTWKS